MLHESGNTLQQVGTVRVIEFYSQVRDKGTTRFIHGLVMQTQFCVNFIALWRHNGNLSNTAKMSVFKLIFVLIPTYGHASCVTSDRKLSQLQA